ncbi:MAG: hypothetical protein ABI700_10515 [Chloroflexota bacterium]
MYRYISAFVGDNGYPPNSEYIAEWLGLEGLRVEKALKRLRAAGRICEGSTLPTVYIEPVPPAT